MIKLLERAGTFKNLIFLIWLQILLEIIGFGLIDIASKILCHLNSPHSIAVQPPMFFHFSRAVIQTFGIQLYSGVLAVVVKIFKLPKIIYKILFIINFIYLILLISQIANLIYWIEVLKEWHPF